MASDESKISFKQLVETRKEEMYHMLPGMMTEVTDGEHSVIVYSPEPGEKSGIKVRVDK